MRRIATLFVCLSLSGCAGLPTRPPLGAVLVITGAVIAAGAIAEHHQANHFVETANGVRPADEPSATETQGASRTNGRYRN